jgi:hypothetical protein
LDDFLHTGDPCPNRRGLEELGFSARPAEELVASLREHASALLVGERVVELCGREAVAALPAELRLIAIDTRAPGGTAVDVAVGAPNAAERAGTWTNVDGLRRAINPAKPAPPGVWALTRTLAALRAALQREGAQA